MGNVGIVNILTRKRDSVAKTCEYVLVGIAIVLAHCHCWSLVVYTGLLLERDTCV